MYKDVLNDLLEGLDDPYGFKQEILKNQLKNHFKNKTPDNNDYLSNLIIVSRQILEHLDIFDIVSVCSINENKPEILHKNKKISVELNKEYYNCKLPLYMIEDETLRNETLYSLYIKVRNEITEKVLNVIESHSKFEFVNKNNDLIETIFSIAKENNSNWIVISLNDYMRIMSNKEYFQVLKQHNELSSLSYVGALFDEKDNIKLKVFVNIHDNDDKILFGHKSDLTNEADTVYGISTILELGNIVEPEKYGDPFYSLLSKNCLYTNKDNNYFCLYRKNS